ncbi:MAG: hypothetical protein M3Y67_09575, partial [Pseudomonadota bacterium]|nr:hypothetical protein [Pseudomonadota bacterium]
MSRSAVLLWARRAGVTLLVLIGVALAVVALQPFWLAPWVAHRLTATSGRAVHFDSMWVGLSGALEPVVHWRGVRIANAAWADAGRPFAALDEAVAYLSWRSIADERPVIALLVLRGGAVDLERHADGLRNWRLRNPEDRGPSHIKVMALRAERTSLRFVHRGLDLELEATASPNDAAGAAKATEAGGVASASASANRSPNASTSASATPGAATNADASTPTHLELKGTWRKLAFNAGLDTGEVITFLETGRTFALRGHLEAGGARL